MAELRRELEQRRLVAHDIEGGDGRLKGYGERGQPCARPFVGDRVVQYIIRINTNTNTNTYYT